MSRIWRRFGGAPLALALALGLSSCSDDDEPATPAPPSYFNRMVYDGASGRRLTSYRITLRYHDRERVGKVQADGFFVLGPLEASSDYTVTIQADGYRPFMAHNGFMPDRVGQTLFYDSYLFPNDLSVAPVSFYVSLSDAETRPAGFLRLQPATSSLLLDEPSERPAGVPMQIWDNDEDLQFNTIVAQFADGVAQLDGKQLVYGVTYALTVFGVPGYQLRTGVYRAGVDGTQSITLTPVTRSPLAIAYRSDLASPAPDGRLTMVFNMPIELDPPAAMEAYRELIDANLTLVSPDADGDAMRNTLTPDLGRTQSERGTSLTVERNTLTIRWDPTTALSSADPGDPILAVTYGRLDGVRIRPVGADSSQGLDLAVLLGSPSVRVALSL